MVPFNKNWTESTKCIFCAFLFSKIMKKIDLDKLLKLVEEKYFIDLESKHWVENWFYLWELECEIAEVKQELKENNKVYLEDELWDIFRCYLNFLKKLEKNWYIESIENVFLHAEEKFSERLNWMKDWISWEYIKKKQKENLKNRDNLSLKWYLK